MPRPTFFTVIHNLSLKHLLRSGIDNLKIKIDYFQIWILSKATVRIYATETIKEIGKIIKFAARKTMCDFFLIIDHLKLGLREQL